MPKTLTARLEAIHSKRDRNGNCYWAFRFTDYDSGKTVVGTVSGGESNISGVRFGWSKPGEWDASVECFPVELPIREFNRLTKSWPYAGCLPKELAAFIRAELAKD